MGSVRSLSRLSSRSTPSVQTARLTTAAATIAVATVAERTPSASPSEATAAGTPSCALAASPALSGLRVRPTRDEADQNVQQRERRGEHEHLGVPKSPWRSSWVPSTTK